MTAKSMRTTSSSSYQTTYSTGKAKDNLKKTVGTLLLILIAAIILPTIPHTETASAQTSQSPSVFIDPATYNATQLNEQFTVNIDISNVQNLFGWAVNFTWDTNYLTLISKQEGSFLSDQGTTQFVPVTTTDIKGTDSADTYKLAQLACDISSSTNGVDANSASGNGTLATMTFQIIRQTQSTPITLGVQSLTGAFPVGNYTNQIATQPQIIPANYFSTSIVSLVLPRGSNR